MFCHSGVNSTVVCFAVIATRRGGFVLECILKVCVFTADTEDGTLEATNIFVYLKHKLREAN